MDERLATRVGALLAALVLILGIFLGVLAMMIVAGVLTRVFWDAFCFGWDAGGH